MLIAKEYPSSSSDRTYRATYETTTGRLTCTCRGFRTPNRCWHVRAIVESSNAPGVDAPARAMAEHRAPAGMPAKPMLAVQTDKARISDWRGWAVEEKFDGHRVIIQVRSGAVTAWSRSGKQRELPAHVVEALSHFPDCTPDGELMGCEGGTFADVRRLGRDREKYLVVFDVLEVQGDSTAALSYDARREVLRAVFAARGSADRSVRLAESRNLESQADVVAFVQGVWARGGEGAILKRRAACYQAGKRSPDFVKVKRGGSCVATVTGFKAGERGPRSSILVRGVGNIETSVKWETKLGAADDSWVGRALRIEYTEVRDGAFVNPHADRWEEE